MKKGYLFLFSLFLAGCTTPKESQQLVIGTAGADGAIYVYEFTDQGHKQLSKTPLASPTFMSFNPSDSLLHSVSETGTSSSSVVTYRVSKDGTLSELSSALCQGDSPCHIAEFGEYMATANYGGGNVSLFKNSELLELFDFNDTIASSPRSHLHCIIPTPDHKYFFATDLGKDSIYRFEVSAKGVNRLYPAVSLLKGTGPRHMTFNNEGNRAYLIGEKSGMVVGFDYKDGNLVQFHSAPSDSVGGGGSGDIHLSPDGRHLYASNRLKADGISVFEVDQQSGKFTKTGYTLTGVHPRNFTLSPDGTLLLVACRDNNAVQIYKRDTQSGLLSYLGEEHDIKLEKPMFVKYYAPE